MKWNQSRAGFELVSPCSFPTTITITPRYREIGSDETEEVKDFVYFRRIENVNQDMDTEISSRIKPGWKGFTTIKNILKIKMEISSIGPFCQRCHQLLKFGLPRRRENSDRLGHRALWKDPCWEDPCWEDPCWEDRCMRTSEIIQERSQVKNMITEYQKQMFCWVRHVATSTDNR